MIQEAIRIRTKDDETIKQQQLLQQQQLVC
jgi:hypothetical protein